MSDTQPIGALFICIFLSNYTLTKEERSKVHCIKFFISRNACSLELSMIGVVRKMKKMYIEDVEILLVQIPKECMIVDDNCNKFMSLASHMTTNFEMPIMRVR